MVVRIKVRKMSPLKKPKSLSQRCHENVKDLLVGSLSVCRSGHKLNSILLTFHNQGSVLKSAIATNLQPRLAFAVFDGVLGLQRIA